MNIFKDNEENSDLIINIPTTASNWNAIPQVEFICCVKMPIEGSIRSNGFWFLNLGTF